MTLCDIGRTQFTIGEVRQIKILGALTIVDKGEAQWKVIGINREDPDAGMLHSVDDIDKKYGF